MFFSDEFMVFFKLFTTCSSEFLYNSLCSCFVHKQLLCLFVPHSLNPHAVKVDVSYGINIKQKIMGSELEVIIPFDE